MPGREVRCSVKDLDPVRQREYAEDYKVVQLYDSMRAEAVRQVREVLGAITNPDDWWFHETGWSNPADRWQLEIFIDGVRVWLNANYRLRAEPHGLDTDDDRIRSEEDFEKAVERQRSYGPSFATYPPASH